jgi:hypothetical protein
MRAKFGNLFAGEDPDYASSWDTKRAGPVDVTQYWGEQGVDLEKSKELATLKKLYGPAMDNKIMGMWMENQSQDPYGVYRYGPNRMMATQDQFLKEHQKDLPMSADSQEIQKRWTLRAAKAGIKNPMLF